MLQGARTSEAEALTGPLNTGGGGCPQMAFHLLCFHTALPSSQPRESALRASSDPSGSAFVTTHPSQSSSLCSLSVSFLLFPSLSLLFVSALAGACSKMQFLFPAATM